MSDKFVYEYTGEIQSEERPYLPSVEVVEAVNLAMLLGRPLLLKGEPGCGKTRLAEAVVHELNQRNGGKGDWPFEFWPVKSTSRARDGLYTFDAIGRLRDAQMAAVRYKDTNVFEEPDINVYVQYGALGKAIKDEPERRTLVLIDEIDKADIDFPNDLLLELDEKRFEVRELGGKVIQAKAPPIVLITSNDEKDLPDAFLRRCVFHYIQFPDKDQLQDILNAHYPRSFEELSAEVIDKIIEYFLELRQKMEEDKPGTGKKVSTSELLDWYRVLWKYDPEIDILAKLAEKFRYPGVLVKDWGDYQRYTPKKDRQS